ncbi:MAG: hypothetical protein Q7R64_02150 [bacterium]|nr:hypothetical protein [bacterium]
MTQLPIQLERFGFVARECDSDGRLKKNRCGRDALYYVLHYYFPDTFSPTKLCPEKIEKGRLFGFKIPDWFPFYSGTALGKVPEVLKRLGVTTFANTTLLKTRFDFFNTCLFRKKKERVPFENAKQEIRMFLEKGTACVIDLPAPEVGPFMNHVLFVCGIDEAFLYIIDTWQLPCFEYEKVDAKAERYFMRFPLHAVENRWNKGGVLWVFEKSVSEQFSNDTSSD